MRVRKREACSESCGNNLITLTLTHHARSKRSEINSTRPDASHRRSLASQPTSAPREVGWIARLPPTHTYARTLKSVHCRATRKNFVKKAGLEIGMSLFRHRRVEMLLWWIVAMTLCTAPSAFSQDCASKYCLSSP